MFITFFPSDRSFLKKNFKGVMPFEYVYFQNASSQNCYLHMKLFALRSQFLRVALQIYLLQKSTDNTLHMAVNFVVDKVRIRCCIEWGWIIIVFFFHYRVYRRKQYIFERYVILRKWLMFGFICAVDYAAVDMLCCTAPYHVGCRITVEF
jgi:hypothetical protein